MDVSVYFVTLYVVVGEEGIVHFAIYLWKRYICACECVSMRVSDLERNCAFVSLAIFILDL